MKDNFGMRLKDLFEFVSACVCVRECVCVRGALCVCVFIYVYTVSMWMSMSIYIYTHEGSSRKLRKTRSTLPWDIKGTIPTLSNIRPGRQLHCGGVCVCVHAHVRACVYACAGMFALISV